MMLSMPRESLAKAMTQIRHIMKTTISSGSTPFADWMQHPEKLEAVLKAAGPADDACRVFQPAGRARPKASLKRDGARRLRKNRRA